jgi:hypothetical protein
MTRLNATDERCEALFASALQRSDDLTAEAVSEAISRTVLLLGSGGCASRMAQEFGDHPEAACERMRWAMKVLSDLPVGPPPTPAAASGSTPAVATIPTGSAAAMGTATMGTATMGNPATWTTTHRIRPAAWTTTHRIRPAAWTTAGRIRPAA